MGDMGHCAPISRPVHRTPVWYGWHSALLAVVLFSVLGCHPTAKPTRPFDAQRAFKEVEALVRFSPRDAGTPGGKSAALHIFRRLKHFGLDAELDAFTDDTPAGEKAMHNVLGRIPGRSGKWIILGSHFDTMPGIEGFVGANDSGSSVGVLLEIARLLADQKPYHGLLFAFFDGEEGIAGYVPGDGLHGSRHLARQVVQSGEQPLYLAMILLDMVGDRDLQFTLPANSSPALVQALLKAAHQTGYREYIARASDMVIIDDHVPFLQIGIPAIDLIDFEFGSAPGKNDYWHTAADDIAHISEESLAISGALTLGLLDQLGCFHE